MVRSQLPQDWKLLWPSHPCYPYEPSLKFYSFIGLDRFTAAQLHQMRSGKSYKAAYSSEDYLDSLNLYPFSEEDGETLKLAILYCNNKVDAGKLYLPGMDNIGVGSPLWGSKDM